jgi:hypothetical protein
MAYHRLSLPTGLPADMERLIRDQLEPHLVDAHAMLRLPIATDPGLQGGCNFAIAQVLLSIVSGVSVTLYDPAALSQKGVSGKKFKQVLVHHYPWNQEQHLPGARAGAAAADELYRLFRNPLAHALGVIDLQYNPKAQLVTVEKGSFAEDVIDADERASVRPPEWQHATLREEGKDHLVLWVRSFYWGVRKMIEDVVGTRMAKGGISIMPSLKSTQWRTT